MGFSPRDEIISEVIHGDDGEITRPLFVVVDILGEGGFGIVYRVRSRETGQDYALKALADPYLAQPDLCDGFADEIMMWLGIGEHDNIAGAYQRFRENDQDFLLIEYVDGLHLAQLRGEEVSGKMSEWQVADVGIQFCEAMIYCRNRVRSFVHRDVKPNNLMLTRDRTLKLIDFGLAVGAGVQTTLASRTAGASDYMAPEVLARRPPTLSSEIYALGITLGALASGRPGLNLKVDGENVLRQEGVSETFVEIFGRCVVSRRYEDFETLRDELASLQDELHKLYEKRPDTVVCTDCGYVPFPGASACPLCGGHLRPWVTEYARVPAGEFVYGCSEEMVSAIAGSGRADERTKALSRFEHGRARLPEFEIATHPVTNQDYAEFVRETNHRLPPHWSPEGPPFPPRLAHHPVVNVSFRDAELYCRWRSRREEKRLRLPDPREWEKAARGDGGRLYPWGDEFDPSRAWCVESPREGWGAILTTPVGELSAGSSRPYGFDDLCGNVWEWVDSFDPSSNNSQRGGSWKFPVKTYGLPFASIMTAPPTLRDEDIGFRVVVPSEFDDKEDDTLFQGMPFLFVPGSEEFHIGCPPRLVQRVAQLLHESGLKVDSVLDKCEWRPAPVDAFFMLKHPVTNADYRRFIEVTSHPAPEHWVREDGWFPSDRASHPVSGVSYEDARRYCDWLGELLMREVRVPMSDEWERASRGDGDSLYPWGSDEFAPYRARGTEYPSTESVYSHFTGASPCHVHNMCGNVWEIVKDRRQPKLTCMGGSWRYACAFYGLTFSSLSISDTHIDDDMGFRIVREMPGARQQRRF